MNKLCVNIVLGILIFLSMLSTVWATECDDNTYVPIDKFTGKFYL